jgi:hypothetical protein
MLVLEPDGTVRRANEAAGRVTGTPAGYATGRPLAAFVDPVSRAAVASQLAAVARDGKTRNAEIRILGPDGPTATALTIGASGELLVAALTLGALPAPAHVTRRNARSETEADLNALRAMARRIDTVTAVTRLLLDNSTFSEAVTLQRCARLLAADLGCWVIIDVERGGELRRQCVAGGDDELSRKVERSEPGPLSLQVHQSGRSELLAHAEQDTVLGLTGNEVPLLPLLGASSVLSVPIRDKADRAGSDRAGGDRAEGDEGSRDGAGRYGVLTLARPATFSLTELALTEDIGEHLGVAIRVDRMFRRRSELAEALQASLLPGTLPGVAGLELSAAYLPAGLEVGGDFYDVFPVPGPGWGITIGDVSGRGHEAAVMTAAARHAIRVLAGFTPDPAQVLARASEIMLSGGYEDRFVTAKLAYLTWSGTDLLVTLASAGHAGPALIRADGRVSRFDGGGLPLGLFSEFSPGLEMLRLTQGDLLFFYTDGVDIRNDELAGLAGRTAAEAVRAVQAGLSPAELRDDATILAAKVTGLPR